MLSFRLLAAGVFAAIALAAWAWSAFWLLIVGWDVLGVMARTPVRRSTSALTQLTPRSKKALVRVIVGFAVFFVSGLIYAFLAPPEWIR